jgi:hypothetical protein
MRVLPESPMIMYLRRKE